MKKLSTALILILISALLCACGPASAPPSDTEPVPDTTAAPEPIDRKQAVELASEHWGVRSGEVDEQTGFRMNIFIDETPTEQSNRFRLALRWLVDGHYSTVDEIYIDADSGEIIHPGEETKINEPIDREHAIELASEFWKVEPGDIDEVTGFMMNIFVDAEPTAEKNWFEMSLRWLVDGKMYSVVDEIYIDADSGEISYPGEADF